MKWKSIKWILRPLVIPAHIFYSKIKRRNNNMWNLSPVALDTQRSGKLILQDIREGEEEKKQSRNKTCVIGTISGGR